ncbi:hypothetical protein C8Q76DRAFT_772421 [Earliella scabrosa]|nr:hypothetical protein C8Q76DRAFT_772421 [Earliella scabrosa]
MPRHARASRAAVFMIHDWDGWAASAPERATVVVSGERLITSTSTGLGHSPTEIVPEHGDIAIATLPRPELLVLKLDVSISSDISAAFLAALDALVAATGGEVEAMPDADARAMFETNFWGSSAGRRCASSETSTRRAAVKFTSIAGVLGTPGLAHYTATKFALEGFIEAVASELDPNHVTHLGTLQVTILAPGGFATPGIKPTLPSVGLRAVWDEFVSEGNPRIGMEVSYTLANPASTPSLHFSLGKDAMAAFKKMATSLTEAAETYSSCSEYLARDA